MLHLTVTEWVMFGATFGLLVYDAYALYSGGLTKTISWQFLDLSKRYPIFPFLLGFLAAHLTTQMTC